MGQKVDEQIFRVDPGKNKSKNVKKLLFSALVCFQKLKQYLECLAIFHKPLVCEGLWKFAKPPSFSFSFSKQTSPEIFKMQPFNTGPVVHLRVVQLT